MTPTRNRRPCSAPGCSALTDGGRCDKHKKKDDRASAWRRGYDGRWRKVRRMKLNRTPLCELRTHCDGVIATEVDHIDGNPRNNMDSNLRSVCKPCHSYRTARDQSGWIDGR